MEAAMREFNGLLAQYRRLPRLKEISALRYLEYRLSILSRVPASFRRQLCDTIAGRRLECLQGTWD